VEGGRWHSVGLSAGNALRAADGAGRPGSGQGWRQRGVAQPLPSEQRGGPAGQVEARGVCRGQRRVLGRA
jgi:hypothetical protein